MKHHIFASDLPEAVIKGLTTRVKEKKGINLGQGIPSFPTAPHIIRAAQKALEKPNIGVYPNFLGNIKLRRAMAEKLDHAHTTAISGDHEVLVTVGAMEATASAILSIINNGDRVGLVTPDYCNHFPQIQLARGRLVEIPMREGERWELELERIEKEAKRGLTLLIITNPNNPTGAVFSHDQLQELVRLSNRYGFWILSDETYQYLGYVGKVPSLVDFWDESQRLLVVRSVSKEYAMTGWRIGFLITRGKTRDSIAKTHDALVGCAPKISQYAALAALTGSQRPVRESIKALTRRREIVVRSLQKLEEYLMFLPPDGAYYAFPKVKKRVKSASLGKNILTRVGVGIIPGVYFGAGGEGHIRISFAVEDRILQAGIKKLHTYFIST